MKIVVSQAALADLARLHAFLAERNPTVAERAIAALTAAAQSLNTFPERGRPFGAHMRELIVPFGRSNYVMRYAYRKAADEIVVIRIWHGREARE